MARCEFPNEDLLAPKMNSDTAYTKELSPLNHHLLLLVKTSFIVVYMVSSEKYDLLLEVRNDSDKDCSVADRQETGFQITLVQTVT